MNYFYYLFFVFKLCVTRQIAETCYSCLQRKVHEPEYTEMIR